MYREPRSLGSIQTNNTQVNTNMARNTVSDTTKTLSTEHVTTVARTHDATNNITYKLHHAGKIGSEHIFAATQHHASTNGPVNDLKAYGKLEIKPAQLDRDTLADAADALSREQTEAIASYYEGHAKANLEILVHDSVRSRDNLVGFDGERVYAEEYEWNGWEEHLDEHEIDRNAFHNTIRPAITQQTGHKWMSTIQGDELVAEVEFDDRGIAEHDIRNALDLDK